MKPRATPGSYLCIPVHDVQRFAIGRCSRVTYRQDLDDGDFDEVTIERGEDHVIEVRHRTSRGEEVKVFVDLHRSQAWMPGEFPPPCPVEGMTRFPLAELLRLKPTAAGIDVPPQFQFGAVPDDVCPPATV